MAESGLPGSRPRPNMGDLVLLWPLRGCSAALGPGARPLGSPCEFEEGSTSTRSHVAPPKGQPLLMTIAETQVWGYQIQERGLGIWLE